jgi:hypothetical protein
MGTKIIMPEMGEGIIEATVARWLKEKGNRWRSMSRFWRLRRTR